MLGQLAQHRSNILKMNACTEMFLGENNCLLNPFFKSVKGFKETHYHLKYIDKLNDITLLTDVFACFRLNKDFNNKVLCLPSHEDNSLTVVLPVVSLS